MVDVMIGSAAIIVAVSAITGAIAVCAYTKDMRGGLR